MANTYQERLIAGLKAKGWREDRTDKSKYTAFTTAGVSGKLFVGPNGALRQGDCASKSHSIGRPTTQSKVYLQFLVAGDQALDPILTLGEDVAL